MRSQYKYRRSSFFNSYFPAGVKWLIVSNVAIFVLFTLFGRWIGDDLRLLALAPRAVVSYFALWQLVTYMFIHGSISHLLFNMLALWMFGVPLEQTWGTQTVSQILLPVRRRRGPLRRGAACRDRRLGNANGGRIGRDFRPADGVWRSVPEPDRADGFPVPDQSQVHGNDLRRRSNCFSPFSVNDGVSNIAHLGGMAFGYVYLKGRLPRLTLPDWQGAYKQWKLQRAKKKFQVYMRKHGDRGPWVN